MGPTETVGISSLAPAAPASQVAGTLTPAKAHQLATQFEAMFMTEMLHQAHSKSHAAGVFRTGEAENTFRPFMDQALGDAVASRGGVGIAPSIEKLLNASQSPGKSK